MAIHHKKCGIIVDGDGVAKLTSGLGLKTANGTPLVIEGKKGFVVSDTLNESVNHGETGWVLGNSGAGSGLEAVFGTNSNHITGQALTTGTTATGYSIIRRDIASLSQQNAASIFFETEVRIEDLSTALEEYAISFGLSDSTTGTTAVDGIYFLYDRAAGTPPNEIKWYFVTSANSTATTTNTTVTVAEDSWITLRIELNSAGTSAKAYIDGTLVATNTTNIPSGTSQLFGVMAGIFKSVGTTARRIAIGRMNYGVIYSTAQ